MSHPAVCPRCGFAWNGHAQHCSLCHQTFGGTSAGDAHRIGPHEPPGARRCLTPDELRDRGMHQDARGVWREASPETLPDRSAPSPWSAAHGRPGVMGPAA